MVEKRNNPVPWIMLGGGALLIVVGFIWIMVWQPKTPAVTATPASAAEVQRVTLEDARAAYDSRKAVFLDVRDSSSYVAAHIPGAVNIPISDLTNRMGELNPKSWIIPYCT